MKVDASSLSLEFTTRAQNFLKPLWLSADRQELPSLGRHLQDVQQLLAVDLQVMESILQQLAAGVFPGQKKMSQAPCYQAVRHLLKAPGKRIRPLCVLLAAQFGKPVPCQTICRIAVACELVHAATLLHDDVIDVSEQRRGQSSARLLFGNAASILGGDYLLVEALRLVMSSEQPLLMEHLLNVISEMVDAEGMQLASRGRFEPSRSQYLKIIAGKTAGLFSWGLRSGALLSQLQPTMLQALEQAGLHLGMAFQLADDVLDFTGEPHLTGKQAFIDLREGKMTWPMIVASEQNPEVLQSLEEIACNSHAELSQSKINGIVAMLQQTDAIRQTSLLAREEAQKACDCLDALPEGAPREALKWLVQLSVERIA